MGSQSEILEERAEGDIPVGIVFEDKGARQAFIHDATESKHEGDNQNKGGVRVSEIQMGAPASYYVVFQRTLANRLMQKSAMLWHLRGQCLTPGSAFSGMSLPRFPLMTSKLNPESEADNRMASSLSVRDSKLITKTFSNWHIMLAV